MKLKYFIDSQKGFTALFVLVLIAVYEQWQNPTAWVYLALHGSYGILWVLKSHIFPDHAWEQKTPLGFGLLAWISLCLYWVAPWLLTWRGIQAPGWYLALCISFFVFGVFFHFSSDMQKWAFLRANPNQLITVGLVARVRNINYFGELLIYLGFGLLAMHWLPVAILAVWVVFYWIPRMHQKDRILSGLPGFEEYKKRSKLFIPFLY